MVAVVVAVVVAAVVVVFLGCHYFVLSLLTSPRILKKTTIFAFISINGFMSHFPHFAPPHGLPPPNGSLLPPPLHP